MFLDVCVKGGSNMSFNGGNMKKGNDGGQLSKTLLLWLVVLYIEYNNIFFV